MSAAVPWQVTHVWSGMGRFFWCWIGWSRTTGQKKSALHHSWLQDSELLRLEPETRCQSWWGCCDKRFGCPWRPGAVKGSCVHVDMSKRPWTFCQRLILSGWKGAKEGPCLDTPNVHPRPKPGKCPACDAHASENGISERKCVLLPYFLLRHVVDRYLDFASPSRCTRTNLELF